MSARLEKLKEMLALAPADPFLHYGVACEMLKIGDEAAGLAELERINLQFPDYHPAHFKLGQQLAQQGEASPAKAVLQAGIAAAHKVGDTKAAREMTELFDTL